MLAPDRWIGAWGSRWLSVVWSRSRPASLSPIASPSDVGGTTTFRDRPVRSLRQFRSREEDDFGQAGGGTDLGRLAPRSNKSPTMCEAAHTFPGIGKLSY